MGEEESKEHVNMIEHVHNFKNSELRNKAVDTTKTKKI